MSDARLPPLAKQAGTFLQILDDDDHKNAARRVQEVDPILNLRTTILGFFEKRMKAIDELETFRTSVRERMMTMLTEDTLSFEQLERLHSMFGSDIRQASESIISIFKGAPGVPSPLAPIMQERDPQEKEKNDLASKLSSEQLQTMNESFNILMSIAARAKANAPDPSGTPPVEPIPPAFVPPPNWEEDGPEGQAPGMPEGASDAVNDELPDDV